MIAISVKAFHGMAERLGRRPQILNWLRRLALLSGEDRPELYNALLNAYMHVKPLLERKQRHEVIETLLIGSSVAAELIYQHALAYKEKSLYGCRLFFRTSRALCKFWDVQDRPGLWICFGPFQLHLTPEQVFSRICIGSGINGHELKERLAALHNGISSDELLSWPAKLCEQLYDNNLVALPGRLAFLHPRASLLNCETDSALLQTDLYTAAALVLEKLWDSAEFPDEALGRLPQHEAFTEAFNPAFVPEIEWQKDFSCDEAWDFIAGLFWQQKSAEAGHPEVTDEDSTAVRMQTTDQEIDPEEGEHGDEETEY
jgi:hypothetical protein